MGDTKNTIANDYIKWEKRKRADVHKKASEDQGRRESSVSSKGEKSKTHQSNTKN